MLRSTEFLQASPGKNDLKRHEEYPVPGEAGPTVTIHPRDE